MAPSEHRTVNIPKWSTSAPRSSRVLRAFGRLRRLDREADGRRAAAAAIASERASAYVGIWMNTDDAVARAPRRSWSPT